MSLEYGVIFHLIPTHPPWEGLEGTPFITTVKYICEGSPSIFEELLWTIFSVGQDLTMEIAATELGNQNAIGVIRPWRWQEPSDRNSIAKGKIGVVNITDSRWSKNQNSLIHGDLWCWLVDHNVPRSEVDRKIYYLARATITKYHRLDDLNDRHLFSHNYGG